MVSFNAIFSSAFTQTITRYARTYINVVCRETIEEKREEANLSTFCGISGEATNLKRYRLRDLEYIRFHTKDAIYIVWRVKQLRVYTEICV